MAGPEAESARLELNRGDLKLSPCISGKDAEALTELICKHQALVAYRLRAAPVVNSLTSNVKTRSRQGLMFPRFKVVMDFQIKLFSWPDRGNHLIMITRGVMDILGFEQIFQEMLKATASLRNCKVVIDLQDVACNLESADIQAFVEGVRLDLWPSLNKVAIVASHELDQYEQLTTLVGGLAKLGLKIAVFEDSKAAVTWLTDIV